MKEQVAAITGSLVASAYRSAVVNETDSTAQQRVPRRYRLHHREDGWEMTLCCRRSEMPFYASKDSGEDTPVLKALQGRLAVIEKNVHSEQYIYMRQGNNVMAGSKTEEGWWEMTLYKYNFKELLELVEAFGCFKPHVYELLLTLGAVAVPMAPKYGRLRVISKQICGEHSEEPVQLCGVSLFWSQWMRTAPVAAKHG